MVCHRPVIKLDSKFYSVNVFCYKMPVFQSEVCLNKDRLSDKMLWKNALTFKSLTPPN